MLYVACNQHSTHTIHVCCAGNKLSQKQTQQQIYDSEKRAMQYNRKYQKIQADYQNLIGIAADLIDSLEQSVQGQPVSTV